MNWNQRLKEAEGYDPTLSCRNTNSYMQGSEHQMLTGRATSPVSETPTAVPPTASLLLASDLGSSMEVLLPF